MACFQHASSVGGADSSVGGFYSRHAVEKPKIEEPKEEIKSHQSQGFSVPGNGIGLPPDKW